MQSTPLVPPADETTITKASGSLAIKDGGVTASKIPDGSITSAKLSFPTAPIGSVFAWLKSLTNTPSLPDGWVECNGQVLSDAGSVYNGITLPNLNGAVSAGLKGYYLRGDSTSGTTQTDDVKPHKHTIVTHNGSGGQAYSAIRDANNSNTSRETDMSTGQETRPYTYTVVWIMRVK